jgi:hypothetical protein
MVLGNTWASVFQTSIDAQAFVLLENPPSIYTSNSHGKDLTKYDTDGEVTFAGVGESVNQHVEQARSIDRG